ncbi:unnamed protein product, partial [Rotaria magnacalcarata]
MDDYFQTESSVKNIMDALQFNVQSELYILDHEENLICHPRICLILPRTKPTNPLRRSYILPITSAQQNPDQVTRATEHAKLVR